LISRINKQQEGHNADDHDDDNDDDDDDVYCILYVDVFQI
jgi:hypothetical protein